MKDYQYLLNAVGKLDADQPGWHRKINLGRFNLYSMDCVIGQVYDAQSTTQVIDKAMSLGLDPLTFCGYSYPAECQNTLAWRSLIAERQEADRIGETLSIPELDEVEGVAV